MLTVFPGGTWEQEIWINLINNWFPASGFNNWFPASGFNNWFPASDWEPINNWFPASDWEPIA